MLSCDSSYLIRNLSKGYVYLTPEKLKRKLLAPEKLKRKLLTPSQMRTETDGRTGITLYTLSTIQTRIHNCYFPCKMAEILVAPIIPLIKYEPYIPWLGCTVYIYTKAGSSYMGRQAKKCLWTCAKCAESDHPAHAQNIIRAFAIHSYILKN